MAESSSQDKRPLAGVKVLELGSLIAGPYAGALFAQFGAEVIKIEPPGVGDALRTWRNLHAGTSLWWYVQSRNKKSVSLNLKSDAGRDIVRRLAAEAEVLIENFRPGTLEKWGLGWDELSKLNPRLVMVRISGYGQSGPRRHLPGFAAIAEGMGGLRHVTGYPDRPPVRAGVSIGDTLASLYGVIGALIAMHHVKAGGEGQVVDVALYEAVFAVMESLMPEYSLQGTVRGRTGASLPGISPSNTYLCCDGGYVIIAANGDALFKRLMAAIGRHDLADDVTLAHNEGRVARNDELDHAIGARGQRDRAAPAELKRLTGQQIVEGPGHLRRHYRAVDLEPRAEPARQPERKSRLGEERHPGKDDPGDLDRTLHRGEGEGQAGRLHRPEPDDRGSA